MKQAVTDKKATQIIAIVHTTSLRAEKVLRLLLSLCGAVYIHLWYNRASITGKANMTKVNLVNIPMAHVIPTASGRKYMCMIDGAWFSIIVCSFGI